MIFGEHTVNNVILNFHVMHAIVKHFVWIINCLRSLYICCYDDKKKVKEVKTVSITK